MCSTVSDLIIMLKGTGVLLQLLADSGQWKWCFTGDLL
jgi:hypothetical protein